MEPSWPVAFILTLATEAPVYGLSLRRNLAWWRTLLLVLLLNLLTHPLAWMAITRSRAPFLQVFFSVEAAVVGVEALVLFMVGRTSWSRHPITPAKALAIASAANAMSAGLGLILGG
jgi:hypothetical protein